jgi:hypothetical protein
MAQRVKTPEESKSGLDFMYIVDTPVGRGADNKRIADIQLVQLFLRHFYSLNPALFRKLRKPPGRNGQEISLSGEVSGQTIDGITVFQQDTIRLGGSAVFADGRVSAPKGFRVAGTKHIFTIFQLNTFFFNSDAENRTFNGNLEKHPVVQKLPLLAAELALPKVLTDLLS